MRAFDYLRADDRGQAIGAAAEHTAARYLGGGTNLVDLMRENIEQPATLIDVTALASEITETDEGGLLIGAGVTNSALAADQRVRRRYPMLARALLTGASARSATWPRSAVMCCSVRAASISMTPRHTATSVRPVAAVMPSRASIAITPFSVPRLPVWQYIRPT